MFFCSFLPLARVFQCLFTLVLVSASSWLAEIWQLSRRWATGELDGVNSHSRDIVASSTSCTLPAARAPRRACSQANDFALCKACKVSSPDKESSVQFMKSGIHSKVSSVQDCLWPPCKRWQGALGVLNFVYSWTSTTATLETEESGRCREVAILERFKDSK